MVPGSSWSGWRRLVGSTFPSFPAHLRLGAKAEGLASLRLTCHTAVQPCDPEGSTQVR